MLGVTAHTHGLGLNQHRSVARARVSDRLPRRALDRNRVIAIHDGALDAIGFRPVGEVPQRRLALDRRRVRPLVIFHDQYERGLLHRRQIQSFVEHAGGGPAVADPRHRHNLLAEVASRHGDPRHDRDQVAQHGNRRDDVPRFQFAEMAGAILAECRRSVARHVLRQNVARLKTAHQQRADIADHGRDPVAGAQCVGSADRDRFLAKTGIESANDLVLPEQTHHLFFKVPVEPHVVVQLEVFFAR